MVKTNTGDSAPFPDSEDRYETWENVVLAAQVRLDKQDNMRAEAEYEMQWDIVPQMLDDQRFLLRHRPVTRTTYTFTLAGPCLRFWEFDPKAFASSRMYRLDDPEHAKDIVDIVAFLTDPEAPFHDRWIPDRRGVTVRPLEQEATQSWTWTNRESPYKYLYIRQALFDSRTVVFAGKAKREDSDDEPTDVIVKAWWTYREVEDYQLKMLDRLHNGEPQLEFDPSHTDPVPMDIIDPKVIACLPRALGVVQVEQVDPEVWKTRSSGKAHSLCIMATSGPQGQRMPTKPDTVFYRDGKPIVLGLRHYGQILLGVCESLWHAASKGIRYRDINLGNILWIWIEEIPGDKTSGRAIGYLIDFGNARYLNTPRRTEQRNVYGRTYALSKDDGRSATPTFCSTHALKLQAACNAFLSSKKELDESGHLDAEDRADRQSTFDNAAADLDATVHRYIDDLESAVYAFIVQMSKISGISEEKRPDLKGLSDDAAKELIWNRMTIVDGLYCGSDWRDMIRKLARIVRTARGELTKEIKGGSTPIPTELTSIENRCFYNVVSLIKRYLPKLPEHTCKP